MDVKTLERRYKQETCDHSAYKRLPIWKGIFQVSAWVCTQCGITKPDWQMNFKEAK